MNVAYGPPPETGVKTLMHVGADDPDYLGIDIHKTAKVTGFVALGLWLVTSGKRRKAAFWTSVSAFAVQLATRPK